jgi:hypothetical protein
MDRVEEIEAAMDRLPPDELRRIANWVSERDPKQGDGQLDRDSRAGRLDFLFEEAQSDAKADVFACVLRPNAVYRDPTVLGSVPLTSRRDSDFGCQRLSFWRVNPNHPSLHTASLKIASLEFIILSSPQAARTPRAAGWRAGVTRPFIAMNPVVVTSRRWRQTNKRNGSV